MTMTSSSLAISCYRVLTRTSILYYWAYHIIVYGLGRRLRLNRPSRGRLFADVPFGPWSDFKFIYLCFPSSGSLVLGLPSTVQV